MSSSSSSLAYPRRNKSPTVCKGNTGIYDPHMSHTEDSKIAQCAHCMKYGHMDTQCCEPSVAEQAEIDARRAERDVFYGKRAFEAKLMQLQCPYCRNTGHFPENCGIGPGARPPHQVYHGRGAFGQKHTCTLKLILGQPTGTAYQPGKSSRWPHWNICAGHGTL